jgi:DNA polymerase-4
MILLADCDQFFVQCARLADPDGIGRERLLLVGGSADGRGVVTSASYETRAFGVRSGMPTARALRLCPEARVVPVPRGLCSQKGGEVRRVLERFSPVVEAASIDEAYIDLAGTEALYRGRSARDLALEMQATVLADTQITISIGGGPGKLVAKLAAGRAKPAGVHIVQVDEVADFMRGHELRAIPGVGPVFTEQLRRLGLVTVDDVLRHEPITLEQWLGAERGAWLYRRTRGLDEARVTTGREARSMSREETFPADIDDDATLGNELRALALRLGRDVRSANLRARTVTVKLRDADFRTRTAARTIPEGVESDAGIMTVARELLARLRTRRRTPVRLLGIALSHFSDEGAAQLPLFEAGTVETERDRSLARAADAVRGRFGNDAIGPASLLDRSRGSGGA